MNALKLYKQAVDKWGAQFQLNMLMEECAELAVAICKFKRNHSWTRVCNLVEEMADVEIMLEQVKETMLKDKKDFEEIKQIKLLRLKERLEE